jgi:hypothetical protein
MASATTLSTALPSIAQAQPFRRGAPAPTDGRTEHLACRPSWHNPWRTSEPTYESVRKALDILTAGLKDFVLHAMERERPELLDTIGFRQHEDHADTRRSKVLLEFEILVHGEQGLEVFRDHQAQQLTVAFRRPPHVNDVADVVPNQISPQWARDALIEQQQQELRSSHGQVRVPRPLAVG